VLESRLNREVEQPVNLFIEHAGYRTFVPTRLQMLQLTAYMVLLWHRSRARKAATRVQVEIVVSSMRSLLANDQQIATLAAKWTLDIIARGHPLARTVTTEEVRESLLKMIDDHLADDQIQHTYAGTIERALSRPDDGMLNGNWELLHTTPGEPFVIGDAPVVTWERTENNFLIYGQGFSRPNVEVLFPISPIACLHIQPLVRRTRRVHTPSTQEVNMAQAAFATAHCFTNIHSDALNTLLPPSFGRAEIGVTAFNVAHRDYSNTMFEILMNEGRWVQPPLRGH
jgi:hypothetical protein